MLLTHQGTSVAVTPKITSTTAEGITTYAPTTTAHAPTTTTHAPTTTTAIAAAPNTDSTLSLVKQLVTHLVEDAFVQSRVRDRDREEAVKGRLKIQVFAILLSHRKDYARERSCLRLNELEEVIWHTHTLRQQRRYDDANALDACLHALRGRGHLESGSDVRGVLRLLVALKGQGGPGGEVQQPVLATLRPRMLHREPAPCFLPPGPLQYGDTFLQRAEVGRPYPSYPRSLYTRLPRCLPQGRGGRMEDMMRLSGAAPGTGVTPLLTGETHPLGKGKVLGALLQEGRRVVSPGLTLTLPRLPHIAEGYTPFTTTTTTKAAYPSHNTTAGDEGYASSTSAGSHSSEEEEDPWEAVLAALPLPSHRSWHTLHHIPEAKEKPYVSEAGADTAHNVWAVYHEVWGVVSGRPLPRLCVRPIKQLCQDTLYLLIGVPSHSFPWSEADECFSIKEGLCHSAITPEALRGSLRPLLECGTLVRRLETQYPPPKSDSQQVVTHGSVLTAFTFAIASVMQVHREMVLSLWEETLLLALQHKAQPLLNKIKYIASLCKITTAGVTNVRQDQGYTGLPRGLGLLGALLDAMVTTKDRDCLLLLVSIFKRSCIPFFNYLEDWIYHGVCSDPGREFMIEVNSVALMRRDRTYWTHGYTLRPQASVPAMFRDVLEEAFVCGKTLNLLRLCSSKHYLVGGSSSQPALQLCVSGEQLAHTQQQCEAYAAHMDSMAVQLQVTLQQKAEEERAHKHRLLMTSSNTYAAALRQIESKMQEREQVVKEGKAVRLREQKEDMESAVRRRREERDREREEDRNTAQEQQDMEDKKMQQETELSNKIENFTQDSRSYELDFDQSYQHKRWLQKQVYQHKRWLQKQVYQHKRWLQKQAYQHKRWLQKQAYQHKRWLQKQAYQHKRWLQKQGYQHKRWLQKQGYQHKRWLQKQAYQHKRWLQKQGYQHKRWLQKQGYQHKRWLQKQAYQHKRWLQKQAYQHKRWLQKQGYQHKRWLQKQGYQHKRWLQKQGYQHKRWLQKQAYQHKRWLQKQGYQHKRWLQKQAYQHKRWLQKQGYQHKRWLQKQAYQHKRWLQKQAYQHKRWLQKQAYQHKRWLQKQGYQHKRWLQKQGYQHKRWLQKQAYQHKRWLQKQAYQHKRWLQKQAYQHKRWLQKQAYQHKRWLQKQGYQHKRVQGGISILTVLYISNTFY
ncbi:Gamma-tubulin complex component 6 [Chionoecetes opilio]|uniref:Gamma-tubulin complex component 6 n=1 Tax=Chionoecetes opilio TaxID=41210 RepID=A0A8J4YPR9_CHIOP|nr:Gamma-tubulin complex component 6 [Chionoecetes opilio]